MPRNALNAGVVDYALAIPDLADELVRLSRHPYVAAPEEAPSSQRRRRHQPDPRGRAKTASASTSPSTRDRRSSGGWPAGWRCGARSSPVEYLALLQRDPDEVRALYEDILIHVTSFFRDPEVFEALESQILPAILKDKPPEAPIRVWVAGCSTGEEVYSIGISLLELLEGSSRPVQIFGSDLSEAIIAKARAGVYPDSALREVSDERRRRYFVKTDRGYRINKTVRDLCVFVQHDLGRDPPFSKLDLVSCRNVLIYFDQALQKRVIPTFHYALNQPGYLLLGRTREHLRVRPAVLGRRQGEQDLRADGARQHAALRPPIRGASGGTAAGRRPRRRRRVPGARSTWPSTSTACCWPATPRPASSSTRRWRSSSSAGRPDRFSSRRPESRRTTSSRWRVHGLLAALRATIAEVKKEMAPVTAERGGGRPGRVHQDLRPGGVPVHGPAGRQGAALRRAVRGRRAAPTPVAAPVEGDRTAEVGRRRRRSDSEQEDRRIPRSSTSSTATKEYLQSLIEEHGRTNDDLGSANEELVSGNEELQSMNEELETAKEELQSTNEELTTVNDELHSRNQEVTQANSDLLNLLVTVDIPIVILDLERRIRRFTPKARSILNVLPSDHGPPDRRHQAQRRRPRSGSADRRGHRRP